MRAFLLMARSYLARSYLAHRNHAVASRRVTEEVFRAKPRVPAQHIPIAMTGDQRNPTDRVAGLKGPRSAVMPMIMEVKVVYAVFGCRSLERCANGAVPGANLNIKSGGNQPAF